MGELTPGILSATKTPQMGLCPRKGPLSRLGVERRMATTGERQGKLDAVQKTLDGLAESIACASAMKTEQQDLLDGIMKQVEDQVLHAIRLELQVIEKMLEKHEQVNGGKSDDDVGSLLSDVHKETTALLQRVDVQKDSAEPKEEPAPDSATLQEEEGEGDVEQHGANEEEASADVQKDPEEDVEDGYDEGEGESSLEERMSAVSSSYSQLQHIVQKRMQAKDALHLRELELQQQARPFWKKVLGIS